MMPVRPGQHHMMGGVHTDMHGYAGLPCLYAAGEAACVSMNGGNRLGSNSLTECLVFGARVGKQAAEDALEAATPPAKALGRMAEAEQRRLLSDYLDKKGGGQRIAAIRRDM